MKPYKIFNKKSHKNHLYFCMCIKENIKSQLERSIKTFTILFINFDCKLYEYDYITVIIFFIINI